MLKKNTVFILILFSTIFILGGCILQNDEKSRETGDLDKDLNKESNVDSYSDRETNKEIVESIVEIINMENSNERGNSVSNLRNGGLIANNGDYNYYSYRNGLWKSLKTEKITEGKELFDGEGEIKNINVVNKWVYFTEEKDWVSNIWKIKTDGSEAVKLADDCVYHAGMYVINGQIFYTSKRNLDSSTETYSVTKMKLDGSNKTTLLNQSELIFVDYNNTLFVMDEYSEDSVANAYKMNMEGVMEEWNDNSWDSLIIQHEIKVDNNNKYYSLDYDSGIVQIDQDGNVWPYLEKAGGYKIYSYDYAYAVQDNTVFLSCNNNYFTGFYRIDPDGTIYKINNDIAILTHVIDDYIYYQLDYHGDWLRCKMDGTDWSNISK